MVASIARKLQAEKTSMHDLLLCGRQMLLRDDASARAVRRDPELLMGACELEKLISYKAHGGTGS